MEKNLKNNSANFALSLVGGYTAYAMTRYSVFAGNLTDKFSKYSSKHNPETVEINLNRIKKEYNMEFGVTDITLDTLRSNLPKTKKIPLFFNIINTINFPLPKISNEKLLKITTKFDKDKNLYEKFLLKTNPYYQTAIGKEALYGDNIKLNKSKAFLLSFHELGHKYHEASSSKFIKSLLKLRKRCPLFTIVPLSTTLFTNSLKNLKQETSDKINILASGTGILLALPKFTEEILASVDGNKLAKKVCSISMYKDVVKTNRVSMAIKSIELMSVGLGIFLAGITAKKISSSDILN